MKVVVHTWLLLMPFGLLAQHYDTASIPDSLKNNANLVTRYEETTIEIKSPGKAVQHERHVYTILNESGDYYARYKSSYGKFNSIKNISGTLYDAKGKETKHVKRKDMEDISGTDDESLMTDNRYVVNSFYCRTYPYTVDYEEDDDINGLLYINDWVPQGVNKAAVEDTKFVVITPKDYILRFKPVNCSLQPVITETSDKKIYTWELKNLPARSVEVLSPTQYETVPFVLMGPSDFEAEGYKGNMSTWQSYGKFMYELARGRDVLPADIKIKVHQLTDKLTDPRQKINILYDFLQNNTHYISIQLGIGGWQPFDAAYVGSKRYGDCKALSNYMVALLKEAGITGKTVEIRAGVNEAEIIKDFPSLQFNHRIVCVPLANDTVWLECTSQSLPAGYLSGFTANRYALLIDENGGTLVHTPKYGLKDNLQLRKVNGTINEEGNLTASINTRYEAEEQDGIEQYISAYSKDKMMEYLKNKMDLPTYDIISFDYKQEKKALPCIDEKLALTAMNYAQLSGRRLFVIPNIITRANNKYKQDEDRKYNVILKKEYRNIDSVEIKIPTGYQPESVPHDITIESKYGKYTSIIKVFPDKIQYLRLYEQYSGSFPPADYNGLVNFYEQVYKADRAKVVLLKNP